MVYDKVGDGDRDVKWPYLAHFCAEKNHTKISYEYSAIKRCKHPTHTKNKFMYALSKIVG